MFMIGSVAMGVIMFVGQRGAARRKVRDNRASYLEHLEHAGTGYVLPLRVRWRRRRSGTRRPANFPTWYAIRPGCGSVGGPMRTSCGTSWRGHDAAIAATVAQRRDGPLIPVTTRSVWPPRDALPIRTLSWTTCRSAWTYARPVWCRSSVIRGTRNAAFAALMQLTSLHSTSDLTVAACVSPAAMPVWQWLRWLPHARANTSDANGVSRRYLTTTVDELEGLLHDEVEAVMSQATQATRLGRRGSTRQIVVIVDTEGLTDARAPRWGTPRHPNPATASRCSTLPEAASRNPRVSMYVSRSAPPDLASNIGPAGSLAIGNVVTDRITALQAEALARSLAPLAGAASRKGTVCRQRRNRTAVAGP